MSLSVDNTVSRTLHSRAETTPSSPTNTGNGHPEYIAYVLVPVFFIMGLLGVLICHLLKKKGYRCTTEAEQEVAEEKVEKIGKRSVHCFLWEEVVGKALVCSPSH